MARFPIKKQLWHETRTKMGVSHPGSTFRFSGLAALTETGTKGISKNFNSTQVCTGHLRTGTYLFALEPNSLSSSLKIYSTLTMCGKKVNSIPKPSAGLDEVSSMAHHRTATGVTDTVSGGALNVLL